MFYLHPKNARIELPQKSASILEYLSAGICLVEFRTEIPLFNICCGTETSKNMIFVAFLLIQFILKLHFPNNELKDTR